MSTQVNLAEICKELGRLDISDAPAASYMLTNKKLMESSMVFSLPKIVRQEQDKLQALVKEGLLDNVVADEISTLFSGLQKH